MKTKAGGYLTRLSTWCLIALLALLSVPLTGSDLYAFTINVIDDTGANVTYGFRYLIEEDPSFCIGMGNTPNCVQPGVPNPNSANLNDPSHTLAVNIHRSHSRTVCSGDTSPDKGFSAVPTGGKVNVSTNPGCVLDPNKHYTVSVLPWHENGYNTSPGPIFNNINGWSMSGRNIAQGTATSKVLGSEICTNLLSSACQVDVVVHRFPLPTAQITVLVFHDNMPINAAFDMPAETGLGGFFLTVSDPVAKITQDAFGNPLGTTYQYQTGCGVTPTNPNGVCMDAKGNPIFVIDADRMPQVAYMGNGIIKSCPSGDAAYDAANCVDPITGIPLSAGEAVVRYLSPNKYTIEISPPANDPDWFLTGTLEGTRGNDAWVRATEPRFNIILGNLNWLVFYGFVKKCDAFNGIPCDPLTYTNPGGTTGSVQGRVVFAHDSHPPFAPGLNVGLPVPSCVVGLNNLSGADEQVFTSPCNADSTFQINNVPPGSYQLTMWDIDINAIIDFRNFVIPPTGGTINLGDVAVFRWFGTLQGSVFNDINKNGFRESGEGPVPNILVNARFSDGSSYQTAQSDASGNYSLSQYFPWWRWLVIEVDSTFYNSTGLTAVVDDGGVIPAGVDPITGLPWTSLGINPQIQPDGLPYRVQTPAGADPALTQAMLLNGDMTNMIHFGKAPFNPGENGGISGYIAYEITRTEEDPAQMVIDGWEPLVPRVKVNLYKATFNPTAPNPQSPTGKGKWVASGPPIATTVSTSFDDTVNNVTTNNPNNIGPFTCVGCAPGQNCLWPQPEIVNGIAIRQCAENFRTWDQIRPGFFDGAYFFSVPNPGEYIVEAVTPPGYKVRRWGDRDIEFGDPRAPFQLYPPECVGPAYQVPHWHQLFPDQQVETPYPAPGQWYCLGTENPDGTCTGTAPLANDCTMKHVTLHDQQNAGANFSLFTDVPKAGKIWGSVWDDLHLEFNPNSPNASGNLGISAMPVSLKDYTGTEIARAYTDQWGRFTAMLPGNYDIAPPIPLGLVLDMVSIFPNDPGPIIDTRVGSPTYGKYITDPWFNRNFGQEVIRENWEFYSGRTTFVDTIAIPISAFSERRIQLNCDYPSKTPEIFSVMGPNGGGPLVKSTGGDRVTITSVGPVTIPNPDYPTVPGTTVTLDHGFGSTIGTVKVINSVGVATNLTGVVWAVDGGSISATVPALPQGQYQLVVTRGDNGVSTQVGITMHVRTDVTTNVFHINPPPASCVGLACARIQPVLNALTPTTQQNALILINPGRYQENVVLYRPVILQGAGAPSTIFDGTAAIGNLQLKDQWNTNFQNYLAAGYIDIVGLAGGLGANFVFEQGAGILVASCDPTTNAACTTTNNNVFNATRSGMIDGLTLTGANEAGGGIYVEGFAPYLKISNNEINANQGSLSGGIRVGTSSLTNPTPTDPARPYYLSSNNDHIKIAHNHITQNGSLFAGGGGISLYNGSDNYQVTDNFLCGNYAFNYGGGISHFGNSPNGLIAHNKIVSNESVDEGGGIMIAGELVPAGQPTSAVTEGAGSVTVDGNLIQGNKAGDDGGGLRTLLVSGLDIQLNPTDLTKWNVIKIFNNMIVNNSSADHGGGLSFDDTVTIELINNTIANNDSTSTGSGAFGGGCVAGNPPGQVCPIELEAVGGLVNSIPRVAGIATYGYSTQLAAVVAGTVTLPSYAATTFSDPVFYNNIVWHNRSFYWDATINGGLGGILPVTSSGAASPYWDFAVYSGNPADMMSPKYSIISDATNAGFANPDPSNHIGTDPLFVKEFLNLYEATQMGAAIGNFVTVTFTPNGLGTTSLYGDYHIRTGSPAINQGSNNGVGYGPFVELSNDYDSQIRPSPIAPVIADIGADEYYTGNPLISPPLFVHLAVFRNNGSWYIDNNFNGLWEGCATDRCNTFGLTGDLPVVGSWGVAGPTKIGVFRRTSPLASWYLDLNGNNVWNGTPTDGLFSFGLTADMPVYGDWTGTGITRIGVFRNGTWYLDINGNGILNGPPADSVYTFGLTGDKPVTGDWNGGGTTKIGVFRPSTHQWLLDWNGNGVWEGCVVDRCYNFGLSTDVPVTGDWNNSGTTKIGVFRNGTWYVDYNGDGIWSGAPPDGTYTFGMTGDKPAVLK